MGYFPMCIDLSGQTVILVGNGPQIQEKLEKLRSFSARLRLLDTLTAEDLRERPAFVIVGDQEPGEAERISRLCSGHGIPVNVVDEPALCTFFFPALITAGDLTVSVSTGGKSPAAAAYLRQQLRPQIPDQTEAILDWLFTHRACLGRMGILRQATAMAFTQNRPLTPQELALLEKDHRA